MPRRVPAEEEPLSRVRLRNGRELVVVNVSNSGALVQSASRLLPGIHVEVHVATWDGRVLARSRVIRAYVCALQADAIWYHGAPAFDRLIGTVICRREAA